MEFFTRREGQERLVVTGWERLGFVGCEKIGHIGLYPGFQAVGMGPGLAIAWEANINVLLLTGVSFAFDEKLMVSQNALSR